MFYFVKATFESGKLLTVDHSHWKVYIRKQTFESRLSTVKGAYKFTTRVNVQLHALQCAAF